MGQNISTAGAPTHEVVIPGQGRLKGFTLSSPKSGNLTTHRFCRVPYALPCLGDYRFKKPRPIPETYDYSGEYRDFGLKCPQPAVANPTFGYTKSLSDEDITHLNIWVPSSDVHKPVGGWPVFIYIHGGWLQYGDPNNAYFNAVELFDDEEFSQKFILVCPGYRLNIFGFLSAKELLEEDPESSNFGFWDQRLAIEWTYKNIVHFGGNPEKITLGGLSAGAYSTFFQLAYEAYHPAETQIIKQIVLFSNGVYVQPKTVEESQEQFNEIVEKLGIDPSISPEQKLTQLRKLDATFIEDFIPTLNFHTFRAVTDDHFVSSSLISDLASGVYAKKLSEKQVRIICGDVDNEPLRYSLLNTPTSVRALEVQVENYYPKKIVPTLERLYDYGSLNPNEEDFLEKLRIVYGNIIGDGQVYSSERGFINSLVVNGFPKEKIFRYRICFRAKFLDKFMKPSINVPHAGDFTVWFYSLREGFTETERNYVNQWLKPYLEFLNFQERITDWNTTQINRFRLFRRDGTIDYVTDPDWEWGVKVAEAVYKCQT